MSSLETPPVAIPATSLPPALTLKKRHALPAFSRHPWVFATSIANTPDGLAAGDEVVVQTDHGKPIARGLYNPDSLIRARLYTWDLDEAVDAALIRRRLESAIALRRRTVGNVNAARLVFSEADGLSGLTVDAYGRWLVLQLTSRALFEHGDVIIESLRDMLDPRGMILRTEKGIQEREGLDASDGVVWGSEPPRPLLIESSGLTWGVDLMSGQKTGFYFDQRANRQAVAAYCDGKTVLDCHTYVGGFALTAAKAGAKQVLGVDSSGPAIEAAQANAERNNLEDQVQFEKADVSKRLAEAATAGEQFDVVIVDPPKLARTRGGMRRAVKAYVKLNIAALKVLAPNGVLVSCSCSGLISSADFNAILRDASIEVGRSLRILESRRADIDHPTSVTCAETDYLKCRICAVD